MERYSATRGSAPQNAEVAVECAPDDSQDKQNVECKPDIQKEETSEGLPTQEAGDQDMARTLRQTIGAPPCLPAFLGHISKFCNGGRQANPRHRDRARRAPCEGDS